MDEFYEYWELIPEFEKYEEVGKEIVKYKRNLPDPELTAKDLPTDVIEFFQNHLISHPYPTWEILYHIIDIRNQEKNRVLEELVLNALTTLIDLIVKHPDQQDKKDKLYNLLSNIYVSEWCMNRVRDNIVPRLYELKENLGLLDEILLLALLSRSVLTLLSQYMNYERTQNITKCRTKSLFLRTCYEKVHWVRTLLEDENDNAISSLDHQVCHHLRFFRLILKLENIRLTDYAWWMELEMIDENVFKPGSALQLCHLELTRQKLIFQFLNAHHHVGSFEGMMLANGNILDPLLSLHVELSIRNIDEIKKLLQTNNKLNERQLELSNESHEQRRTEIELFHEYMIVKLYLNLIQSSDASQDFIDEHLNNVRNLLKTINDGNVLFQLMQNVFTLLFLRFEHIRKTKRKRKNSEIQSGSISNATYSYTTDVSDGTADTLLNGFVCLKTSLKAILNSMRIFLMGLDQLEVHQTCSDSLKEKFASMLKDVDNALWRLSIIDGDGQKKVKSTHTVNEWLSFQSENKVKAQPEIASDDEKVTPRKNVNRKKLKKRLKISVKTDENDEASDDPIVFQLLTETSLTENSENRAQSRSTESQRRVRSIMSKMLMNPESLVTMCMLKGDYVNVQRVTQEYNLEKSEIVDEVNFINNFKTTKDNLQKIVDCFKKITQRAVDAMSKSIEIDEIRNVAEGGFEKVKFLNALEKFTSNNKFSPPECDIQLLNKAIVQHANLKMYQGDRLNVLPVIDFMISLPCPYELNHNIYKYIMIQWNLSEVDDGHFGYRKFLKNLMDILTILKNNNIDRTIEELFNDDIFTNEPIAMKKQFENRKNLIEFMKMDVNMLNDEGESTEILHKFDLFDSGVNFLGKIVSYIKNVRHLMKFQTNESFSVDSLMMMDLDHAIGKIIFRQQHSPEQVENFAYNVNVNLIHSMAVAATGEILNLSLSGTGDEKLLSLFHMSEIGASTINTDLKEQVKQHHYTISNMDILYYIKKKGSFMVAYLVKEIQGVDYKTLKYEDPNFIQRLMELNTVKTLMDLYNNSKIITALNYDHINLKLLFKKIKDTEDLEEKLKILSSISERQWNRNKIQFDELRDSYIEILITTQLDKLERLEEIGSVRKFSELLLKSIGDIKSDDDAERWLRWCLDPKNADQLDATTLDELQNWMKKLKIYRKVVKMFRSGDSDVSWAKVKSLSDSQPEIIVNFLLNIKTNLVLCMDFLKIHPINNRTDEITKMWVEALNNKKLNDQHPLMFKIIYTFPQKSVFEFFDFSLGFIRNLPAMVKVMSFINSNIKEVSSMNQKRYQKFAISTKIFECLDEREVIWSLASRPLVILEQFLMNSKVETLRNVIKEVKNVLDKDATCSACATTSSNMYQVGENLIYDFDAHHDDLMITNECVDLLLKLYAAKALDFQIVEVHSFPSPTEGSSLDSSYGLFQMPKEVPAKEQWIPDGDTSHCMCCKRQKFSLLTRRHHCRRCGRVVCQACSKNRVQLGCYYDDLEVRVCLDCYQMMNVEKKRSEDGFADKGRCTDEPIEWKLTGNISSDQLVRDEFNFEYSPNVGLCIAIIDLHTSNDELAKFLLFHCHRLELLLRPIRGKLNPEVDLILVAKMLKCLAFSAKIRGSNGEANSIIDHADVILKVAENGCESIAPQIPMETINTVTIRAVINDLIKAENWKMALELSVKWDRSGTAGVFSAWGVSAIKCGQYRFAREKIALALQPVSGSSMKANEEFINMLNGSDPVDETQFQFKRVSRSPPLLHEVLESLETTASKQTISGPLQSPFNTKLSPMKESSKNVLNVMDSLRKIVEGDYGSLTRKPSDKFKWHSSLLINSPYYDESMFYLINYGGNDEFLTFLMRNNLVPLALRYVLAQQVSHELFIQHVLTPVIKVGKLQDLIKLIQRMDPSLLIWKEYIMSTCKYLERRRAFNCLYQLQILTGDLVRAALTCIKFYLDGSGNYTELHAKAHHLANAKNHLQAELEKTESKKDLKKDENQENGKKDSITLKWDLKTINAYINIITLQLQIAKYLAKCEADGLPTIGLMPKIFMDKPGMKTMFGKSNEKSHVAILLLVCGHSIESGFGISYRVIHECSLKSTKIYTTCTKYLARNLSRLLEVEKLVTSIKANAANEENVVDSETIKVCDELIAMAVEIAYNQHQTEAKTQIDQLIKLISSRDMKIQCYINSNQLKTAYMLCAATNNLDDIRRIMKQAESTRQENVRRLCEKKLYQRSDGQSSQGSKGDINQL